MSPQVDESIPMWHQGLSQGPHVDLRLFQIFSALEGEGYIFSHSVIVHGVEDYIPSVFITFYFFGITEYLCSKEWFSIFFKKTFIFAESVATLSYSFLDYF